MQARRIYNKAKVNEDPHTSTIRMLRAEVEFLKQQLSAAQHSSDVKSLLHAMSAPDCTPGVDKIASTQVLQSSRRICNVIHSSSEQHGELNSSSAHTGSGTHQDNSQEAKGQVRDSSQCEESVHAASGPISRGISVAETADEHRHAEHAAIQTADAEVGTEATADMDPIEKGLSPGHTVTKELVDKIVRYAEVSKALKRSHDQLAEANSELRTRFLRADEELASLRSSMTTCEAENVELRELGTLLSSAVKVVACSALHMVEML